MNNTTNDLKKYIDANLKKNYHKLATIKNTESSKIYIYQNNSNHKKLVKRISKYRNDDVFRKIRNINLDNLMNIYEVCSDDDALIVLEEFIEGKSLLTILEDQTLSTKVACRYAYQICNALIGLHDLGIIHRDIKPSNIIINNDNEAILIDMGIARLISSNGEKDTCDLGTVGFAAPEQFGISQSGKSTDLYSLGILLNIMITGVHPVIETAKGPIKKIINKAISTEISKRYSDARDMQKSLRFFI